MNKSEWRDLRCIVSNTPFKVKRLNYPNASNSWIVTESKYNHNGKSLTNSIEDVIEHMYYAAGSRKSFKLFQYCENEGVFEVTWHFTYKITRDGRPFDLDDIKWTKVSDSLEAFEVLYAI